MPTQRPRILVVDDDAAIREILSTALGQQGYDVVTAADGTEGLMLLERMQPELVVLDVIMPRRSGFQILDRIVSAAHAQPKVILITGTDSQRVREIQVEGNIDGFFAKPFDVGELVDHVKTLVSPE
ncbi:MAG: response regulator [Planctomycetota bacterium]|nr:response regulator [Planctomycetota bacterium]MDA1215125.1 response regulator [Planctomycetota bacterium]